jgi:hypothetical protein
VALRRPARVAGRVDGCVDEFPEAEAIDVRDQVVSAGEIPFDGIDGERGKIARVDHLEGILRRARRDELAAARGARRPPGEAIGIVVGADDEARPDDGGASGHGLLGACSHSAFRGP